MIRRFINWLKLRNSGTRLKRVSQPMHPEVAKAIKKLKRWSKKKLIRFCIQQQIDLHNMDKQLKARKRRKK